MSLLVAMCSYTVISCCSQNEMASFGVESKKLLSACVCCLSSCLSIMFLAFTLAEPANYAMETMPLEKK